MPTGPSAALVWCLCANCKRGNLKQDSQTADNQRKAKLEKARQAGFHERRQGKVSDRSLWSTRHFEMLCRTGGGGGGMSFGAWPGVVSRVLVKRGVEEREEDLDAEVYLEESVSTPVKKTKLKY